MAGSALDSKNDVDVPLSILRSQERSQTLLQILNGNFNSDDCVVNVCDRSFTLIPAQETIVALLQLAEILTPLTHSPASRKILPLHAANPHPLTISHTLLLHKSRLEWSRLQRATSYRTQSAPIEAFEAIEPGTREILSRGRGRGRRGFLWT